MTTEVTMSVQSGLNKLKLLDSQINSAIQDMKVATISQGDAICTTEGHKIKDTTVAEFRKEAEATLQKIKHLISNRNKIKRAIILSNAKTLVKIGTEQMTVAEAIERKSSISYELKVVTTATMLLNNVSRVVDKLNTKIDHNAEEATRAFAGPKESEQNMELLEHTRRLYESQKYSVLTPEKLEKTLLDMRTTNEVFLSEVDSALTEANVLNTISVDLTEAYTLTATSAS